MEPRKKIVLNKLQKNQFIEIFYLEEINENIFNNYQRYDFYQIIWFTQVKGNIIYSIDFKDYNITKDQVVIIFPGQIDRLNIKGKKGFLFAIHNDNFFHINQRINSPYLNGYFSNVFITLNNETIKVLQVILKLMLTEHDNDNRIPLMEIYMESFLFHISALFESTYSMKNKVDSQVSELMKFIDYYFTTEREVEFYANKLGVTRKKLNQIAVTGTGKTVKEHLQERLILEIKKEIRLQEKSLKEISFNLGFSEPAYFTRFFKQQTSITPSQFKENS